MGPQALNLIQSNIRDVMLLWMLALPLPGLTDHHPLVHNDTTHVSPSIREE